MFLNIIVDLCYVFIFCPGIEHVVGVTEKVTILKQNAPRNTVCRHHVSVISLRFQWLLHVLDVSDLLPISQTIDKTQWN